jgi:hypothetical protein
MSSLLLQLAKDILANVDGNSAGLNSVTVNPLSQLAKDILANIDGNSAGLDSVTVNSLSQLAKDILANVDGNSAGLDSVTVNSLSQLAKDILANVDNKNDLNTKTVLETIKHIIDFALLWAQHAELLTDDVMPPYANFTSYFNALYAINNNSQDCSLMLQYLLLLDNSDTQLNSVICDLKSLKIDDKIKQKLYFNIIEQKSSASLPESLKNYLLSNRASANAITTLSGQASDNPITTLLEDIVRYLLDTSKPSKLEPYDLLFRQAQDILIAVGDTPQDSIDQNTYIIALIAKLNELQTNSSAPDNKANITKITNLMRHYHYAYAQSHHDERAQSSSVLNTTTKLVMERLLLTSYPDRTKLEEALAKEIRSDPENNEQYLKEALEVLSMDKHITIDICLGIIKRLSTNNSNLGALQDQLANFLLLTKNDQIKLLNDIKTELDKHQDNPVIFNFAQQLVTELLNSINSCQMLTTSGDRKDLITLEEFTDLSFISPDSIVLSTPSDTSSTSDIPSDISNDNASVYQQYQSGFNVEQNILPHGGLNSAQQASFIVDNCKVTTQILASNQMQVQPSTYDASVTSISIDGYAKIAINTLLNFIALNKVADSIHIDAGASIDKNLLVALVAAADVLDHNIEVFCSQQDSTDSLRQDKNYTLCMEKIPQITKLFAVNGDEQDITSTQATVQQLAESYKNVKLQSQQSLQSPEI